MFVRASSMKGGTSVMAIVSLRESDATTAPELAGIAAERAAALGVDITFPLAPPAQRGRLKQHVVGESAVANEKPARYDL
jgi:hypothetical protein